MLKKALLFVAITTVSIVSYGQGLVIFDTGGSPTSPNANARAFGDSLKTTPAFGSGYYVQLYATDGANQGETLLTPKGVPVNFKATSSGASTAGYVQVTGNSTGANGTVAVPSSVQVTGGQSGQVTLQIRAWSSAFATFGEAVLANAANGRTILFNLTPDYLPAPTTVTLVGLGIPSFSVVPVPEPSTIALGVLGAGSLLFLRRKK